MHLRDELDLPSKNEKEGDRVSTEVHLARQRGRK